MYFGSNRSKTLAELNGPFFVMHEVVRPHYLAIYDILELLRHFNQKYNWKSWLTTVINSVNVCAKSDASRVEIFHWIAKNVY